MHTEADTDFMKSARALGAHIAELSKKLVRLEGETELKAASSDLVEELTELLRAQERLKECIDYRPLASSCDAQRTWTHDFRNHLNAVKGYAELVQEDPDCDDQGLLPLLGDILRLVHELNLSSTEESQRSQDSEPQLERQNERTGVVLVVEDNEENRRLLVRVLRAQDHTVIEAASGAQAFEQLENNNVELVLLDLILPDMNGYEILQRLKSDRRYRSISVGMV